jgi:hypothetical protein
MEEDDLTDKQSVFSPAQWKIVHVLMAAYTQQWSISELADVLRLYTTPDHPPETVALAHDMLERLASLRA